MSNSIDKVYNNLLSDIQANPTLERKLEISLQSANHSVQMHFIQKYEEGYCAKFAIPDKDINNIFREFPSVIDDAINHAFIDTWMVPTSSNMHTNIYYHRLLLIALYGAKNNKDDLAIFAIKLVLYRIWNGRLCRLIKWCNPEIMAAAIANIRDNRSLAKKYSTPLDLIQNYFAPTIYKKYKSYVIKNSKDTKVIFEQCYNRLKQVFGSNSRKNLKTGQTEYQTGIQPEYYKAHASKSKISKSGSDLEELDDKFTTSSADSLVENVTTFIVFANNVNYNTAFVNDVATKIKGLRATTVPTILKKIHQSKYHDLIREIVEIFFRRLRGISQTQICSDTLFREIQTKIISSKNNQDVNHLKKLADKLLDEIFTNDLDKKYEGYLLKTENQRAQYKIIIFYGIAYNIRRSICENFK